MPVAKYDWWVSRMAGFMKSRGGGWLRHFGLPGVNRATQSMSPAESVVPPHSTEHHATGPAWHGHKIPHSHTPDYIDLFEYAPVGYMLLNAAGIIEKINHTGAAMLGWDAPWLEGKPFSRWVANNDKQLFHAHQRKLHSCESCISQELRIKNRQGRMINLRLESAHARKEDTKRPTGGIGCRSVMIDVSGELQTARKLRRLQSQLTHVARLNTVGEIASSLAHELNQPLGTIVLNCETALRLLNSGTAQDYEFAGALTQAREAASFASDVVRHLRCFLRSSDELHTVRQLSTLIRDVSPLVEADARDDDISLELDIEQNLPSVRVDSVQIEQVLLNLAHNSIEAMRGNGGGPNRVTIKARLEPPNQIRVSVKDTGPGLDVLELDRIFAPFYTTKRDGMGMGLSISRTIVEAHGGQLWAGSKSGTGAVIHFTLPTVEKGPA